ncbi:MAG: hypothetical protein ACOX52_11760 [Verrucomicrobiota bacterium]
MEPTHPDRVVENVTAHSAGGFPGPDGEGCLRGWGDSCNCLGLLNRSIY